MYNQDGENIRSRISDLYRKSDIGYFILRPFFKLYEIGLSIIPDKLIIKSSFKKHMGYPLDLDNPKTLNEKINWLKLNDRKDLHTIVADKYKVRDYIEKKIGKKYLIPLLFHTKNPKDLCPENLPYSGNYIIKTNHDSSGGVIVRDPLLNDWKSIRKRFKRLLKENHYYSTIEWQYKNIERRIIVEKLLTYEDGSIPEDYKFHCFNGKMVFVMVDFDRYSNKRTRNLYDSNWDLLPCKWGRPNGKVLNKPENFNEMKKIVETLAKEFKYVRIDLYLVKGNIYFGEITLHHASGFQKFFQHECDEKYGEKLKLI